jgi:hypothetical protein
MPQLAIAGIGAMIGGAAISGTVLGMTGAAIGWSVGGIIGSMLFAPDGPKAELQDTRAAKLQFGAKIPRLDGRARLPCNPRWQSDWRATSQSAGGKGGGGGSEYYTYACDALLWVCEGVDDAVGVRLWHNGKLVYSTLSNESIGEAPDPENEWARVAQSVAADNELFSSITFFDGNATQMPWPVYEAAVGTANADAHRGLFCVAIENYQGGQSPQMGLWECEVVTSYDQDTVESPQLPVVVGTASGSGSSPTLPAAEAGDILILVVNYIGTLTMDTAAFTVIDTETTPSIGSNLAIIGRVADGTATDLETDFTVVGAAMDGGPFWAGIVVRGNDSDPQFPGVSTVHTFNRDGDGGLLSPTGLTHSTGTYQIAVAAGWRDNLPGSTYSLDGVPAGYTEFGAAVWQWEHPFAGGTTADAQVRIGYKLVTGTTENAGGFPGTLDAAGGAMLMLVNADYSQSGQTHTPQPVDLADIVTKECVRAGLDASLIDVSELVGTEVTGFVRQGSAREAIEQLMAFYHFGVTCRDKLIFRDLGASAVATIPFEDTGAGNDKAGEPFTGVDRGNDQEVPAYWSLTTPDIDADYEAGTETSDRMITASVEKRQVQMTVIATPAERKGRAQALALRARVESHKFEATLDNSHAELEPFDVVTYTDEDGNTYRTRAERESYDGLVKRFEGVLDSANLPTEGVTSATYTPTIDLAIPGTVDGMLLDGPIARDADDDHGIYWVTDFADGASAASLYRSTDDVAYSNVEISTADAITGTAAAALGDWTGGNVWDEVNSVRVTVTGALTASTREAMELDPTINAAALGAQGREEYFRFRTPTLVSSTATSYTYDLTGLLRGRRGTEHAMASHAAGDRFILLRLAGLRRVAQDSDQAGLARFYKHVVAGRSVSGTTAETFTNAAVGRKPFAPVDGQVARDGSGNATITWARRTRLSHRLTGPLAWSFPLGEATEAYVVTIYDDNTYTTAVRTISATSESAAYSAANQTTDFGSPQSTIYFTVAQVSETVGNGYEHRAAA